LTGEWSEATISDMDARALLKASKREISDAIDPPAEDPIELRRGRKAISEYRSVFPSDTLGAV